MSPRISSIVKLLEPTLASWSNRGECAVSPGRGKSIEAGETAQSRDSRCKSLWQYSSPTTKVKISTYLTILAVLFDDLVKLVCWWWSSAREGGAGTARIFYQSSADKIGQRWLPPVAAVGQLETGGQAGSGPLTPQSYALPAEKLPSGCTKLDVMQVRMKCR